MSKRGIIVPSGITLRAVAQMVVLALVCLASGCLGEGGAVNVRWRIQERETGRFDDPRDDSDPKTGVCCQVQSKTGSCDGEPGWHIVRVRIAITDPTTNAELQAPPGFDAECGERELTTPFSLTPGLYNLALRAYDPAVDASITMQSVQSPSPEQRSVHRAEIVNLDVVELSVSAVSAD